MKKLLIICAASMAIAPVVARAEDPYISTAGNHGNEGEKHFIDTAWTITAKTRVELDYALLEDWDSTWGCAVTLNGVRFVFVDTGEDKDDSTPVYQGVNDFDGYLARVTEWVKGEVASREWKTARARVVVQHIPPPLCKGGWAPKLKRLDALNEAWKTANVTLMMGAHLHWWCWMDPWEGRPYPLVVGGGPYLSRPDSHGNPTLTKCRLDGNRLSVKVLDQAGKAVVAKEIVLS